MFLGTIEPVVRNFLAANAEAFRGQVVAVGCSGNFTSERVLWESTSRDVQLFSNDVSLYSSIIGAHLAGQPFDAWINEPGYTWLNAYLDQGGWTRIAALLVFYRALMYERQRNAHEKRMWGEYMQQFPNLVAGTTGKLNSLGLKISGYYPGDIFEHFKQMDTEFGERVIYTSYMPFFKGGYEHLYKRLDAIFGWDRPTYPMLDDERRIETLGEQDVAFQEITLAFFPSEIERLDAVLEQIKQRKAQRYAVQTEQFDRFVDRIMDFKEAAGIYNSATALLAILDIVEEWLAKEAQAYDMGLANLEAQNG